MSTRMDRSAIEGAQIKVARTSSAKYKADRILIPDTIKQAKPVYHLGSRVALPFSAFPDRGFVELPIVSANKLESIPGVIRGSLWMSADTAGINDVRLL